MRLIIAGSRNIKNPMEIERTMLDVRCGLELDFGPISEVVCGGAAGVDKLGEQWARANCLQVALFLADWERCGKSAGVIRNRQMAEYAAKDNGALLAIWDGESKGTANMILQAHRFGLRVIVKVVKP